MLLQAPRKEFGDRQRWVFMSDCHRGDGCQGDEFRRNKAVFVSALDHYFAEGYTYVELGDGDDLWKHRHFDRIWEAHEDVFRRLGRFQALDRLWMVWGNHDARRREGGAPHAGSGRRQPWNDFPAVEGLVLEHAATGGRLLCLHGHQVDLLSSRLARLSQLFIRNVWRHAHRVGLRDPTGKAVDVGFRGRRAGLVERHMLDWIGGRCMPLMCGHTHRPAFPTPGGLPYLNTGSCLHPDGVTAIEMRDGTIQLVKWQVISGTGGRQAAQSEIDRRPMSPARSLRALFSAPFTNC